ncbi:MAG: pseudouridine synthase [Nitrospiraceae bacterium]
METKADRWVLWPRDAVTLDGTLVAPAAVRLVLFHKPKGIITTRHDERGRRSLLDVLPVELHGLQAVGRLDQATSGVLVLTNDSDLGNLLTDPTHRIEREYIVTVRGAITTEAVQGACDGLSDAGDWLQWRRAEILKQSQRESHLRVTLTEGKNREVRRICAALGHEVTRLRRIRFGPFSLDGLEPGNWREVPVSEARQAVNRLLQSPRKGVPEKRSR